MDDTRTKEERDEYVRQKMETMKKKNEEIMRRHLEIEADKREADMHSQTVIANKKNNPQPIQQVVQRERKIKSPRVHQTARNEEVASPPPEFARRQRLSETDAPPPDPNFNFLSDPSRDRNDVELGTEKSRRHKGNYGGEDFQNVKESIKQERNYAKEHPTTPPKNKMERSLRMTGKERRDYENWRQERQQIDQQRIARQKTSQGTWRREWDNEKLTRQNEDHQNQRKHEMYRQPQRTESWREDDHQQRPPNGRGRGRGRRPDRHPEDEYASASRFSNKSPNWRERTNSNPNSRFPQREVEDSSGWDDVQPDFAFKPEDMTSLKVQVVNNQADWAASTSCKSFSDSWNGEASKRVVSVVEDWGSTDARDEGPIVEITNKDVEQADDDEWEDCSADEEDEGRENNLKNMRMRQDESELKL